MSRKKLYEMNNVISDRAEYGGYLFSHAAVPLLKHFMSSVKSDVIGRWAAESQRGRRRNAL
jgi:ketol-acid reductoisomerase